MSENCQKCGKPIARDMAYVIVKGEIILRDPNSKRPMVFSCLEQAHNYAQQLLMHDVCWIETLKQHGAKLFDMGEVAEKYRKQKEVQDGLG